jgi:FAD synthase
MQSEKKAIALGCFDGLHRGHMAVINAALPTGIRALLPLSCFLTNTRKE